MKKILILSSIGLLLGACGTVDTEESMEPDQTVETAEATNAEEHKVPSLVSDPLTTTFEPKVTEVPQLTEEEKALHYELNERIATEIEPQTTDREFMASIADDYPEYTPEELGEFWYKGADANMYGGYGDTIISHTDWIKLMEQVVRENTTDSHAFLLQSDTQWRPGFTETNFRGTFDINGSPHDISIFLEHSGDYSTAALTSFIVDGEEYVQ